jgi:hypothetical protein
MGTKRWDPDDWSKYSATTSAKPAAAIFTSRNLHEDLDPKKITIRESRDSDLNPNSTPVIAACDVTGSMGMIADYFVKTGLGKFFEEVLDRKPVSDPHLMVMGVGDFTCDHAPLQVSQFEADIKIAEQLEKVYIEGGGGANDSESYDMAVYFAAYHTSIDCYEKHGRKGYLFTIGDEMPPDGTPKLLIEKFTADTVQATADFKDTITAAEKMYNYYHIIVAEGNYARRRLDSVKKAWTELLGQNAVVLEDYHSLSELMVSLIEINEGRDKDDVISSWSGTTAVVIASAVKDIKTTGATSATGVVLFD